MHRVVALVRPVQPVFELGCAAEVFGTTRQGVPQHYRFDVCTENVGSVPMSAGRAISVPRGLSALNSADTIVIPGWLPVETPPSADVAGALLRAHDRGSRIVTICTGVFALAHTGLLDGRAATAHRDRVEQLQNAFPAVRVETGVPFVDHGDVATSAGGGAGIELCLHLVGKDHGARHAALLAESMGFPLRLDDTLRTVPREYDDFDELVEWADRRLSAGVSVRDLSNRLGVSDRTLARRFAARIGTSPGAWLLSRRVDVARTMLEQTDLSVEAIAERSGFASTVNFRRRFRDALNTTPAAHRRQFRTDRGIG